MTSVSAETPSGRRSGARCIEFRNSVNLDCDAGSSVVLRRADLDHLTVVCVHDIGQRVQNCSGQLSKSGLLSGHTRRFFGADFGFGRPKWRSIPTGPSQGSSGAKRWATSATRRLQEESPFAVDVITGLPFTSQERVEP